MEILFNILDIPLFCYFLTESLSKNLGLSFIFFLTELINSQDTPGEQRIRNFLYGGSKGYRGREGMDGDNRVRLSRYPSRRRIAGLASLRRFFNDNWVYLDTSVILTKRGPFTIGWDNNGRVDALINEDNEVAVYDAVLKCVTPLHRELRRHMGVGHYIEFDYEHPYMGLPGPHAHASRHSEVYSSSDSSGRDSDDSDNEDVSSTFNSPDRLPTNRRANRRSNQSNHSRT